MKKLALLFFLLISLVAYSQYITRGPDVGEIYFLGPTTNGYGLYYSTDFGETATFIDGTMDYVSIAADKTKGGIYCIEYPSNLYYNDNYGYASSWEFKSSEISSDLLLSGVVPGHVFSSCYKHSEDFGANFITHTLNGWYGSGKYAAIDNTDENIGYAFAKKTTVADTVYLFRTYDTFENIELIDKLNYPWYEDFRLKRGLATGEVYLFDFTQNKLWVSSDSLDNLNFIEDFNFSGEYHIDCDGGQQLGEIFISYVYINMMWQNAHIYIFHSTDYGKTFEVFHPFAKGNEPVLANFSTDTTEGEMPFTVDFCNFSIGDIQQYEWDFENDGIIDSYEETPSWTYQDTGNYSVRLTITGPDSSNTFVKENYIHVYNLTGIENNLQKKELDFNCYPNPLNQNTNLHFETLKPKSLGIKIYNITGNQTGFNKYYEVDKGTHSINLKLEFLPPGIYYISLTENGERISVRKLVVK